MYILNKVVWFFLNPFSLALVLAFAGALAWACSRRFAAWGRALTFVALLLLWFISTPLCMLTIGLPLERDSLPYERVESLPKADAIVVLGGGIGKAKDRVYPDMMEAADRVWHAARLWKAEKAPRIVVSGSNDLSASVPLLVDLGVPRDAIVVDNQSRNTYENSRFTEKLLGGGSVLLVTSAWHMPRARGNFARTSLKVFPAPADFTVNSQNAGMKYPWDWVSPSADSLMRTSFLFKEWLGRLARR